MKNNLTKFQENAHLSKEIQWQYRDTTSNKWQSFSLYLNSTIEQACNRKLQSVKIFFGYYIFNLVYFKFEK